MPFNPDEFLKEETGFDPDAFLTEESAGFDPDAFLKEEPESTPQPSQISPIGGLSGFIPSTASEIFSAEPPKEKIQEPPIQEPTFTEAPPSTTAEAFSNEVASPVVQQEIPRASLEEPTPVAPISTTGQDIAPPEIPPETPPPRATIQEPAVGTHTDIDKPGGAFSALGYGLDQIGITSGDLIKWGGDITKSKTVQKVGDAISKHFEKRAGENITENLQKNLADDWSLLLSPSYLLDQTLSAAPSLATAIGPGMVGGGLAKAITSSPKVAKWATILPAAAAGGTMEGTGVYKDMRSKGFDVGESTLGGVMMTTASMALNAISFSKMFAKLPDDLKSKVISRIGGASLEAITEWGEEPASVIAEKIATGEYDPEKFTPELLQAMRDGINVLPSSFILGFLGGRPAGSKASTPIQKETTPETPETTPEITVEEPKTIPEPISVEETAPTAELEKVEPVEHIKKEVKPKKKIRKKPTEREKTEIRESIKIAFKRRGDDEATSEKKTEELLTSLSDEDRSILEETVTSKIRDAETDELTGLLNRKWAKRNGKSKKSVDKKGKTIDVPADGKQIFVDIDNFKKVNNDFGEAVGDEVLADFSVTLKKNLGDDVDIVRWGGEEIVPILKDKADEKKVLNKLEEVREDMKNMEFADGKLKGVTFSAGFGKTFEEANQQEELAKRAGKNQTFIGGKKYAEIQPDKKSIPRKSKGDKDKSISKPPPSRKKAEKPKEVDKEFEQFQKSFRLRPKQGESAQEFGKRKKAAAKEVFEKEKKLSKQSGVAIIPSQILESEKKKVPEPAKKAHEQMVSEIQTREFESDAARNRIEQELTPKEREALPFVIEKTKVPKELKRADLEEVVNDPARKEKLSKVAENVKKHFHEQWTYMQKHIPDMSAAEIENYVTHIWDIPKSKVSETVNWFKTRNQFLKKRFISTYEAGIKRGLKPKTLDIAKIMTIHDRQSIRTTEHIRFLEALKGLQDDAGVKLIQRSDKAPEGWKTIDHPVLRRAMFFPGKEGQPGKLIKVPVKYHPSLDPMMQAVFGSRFKPEGRAPQAILGAYEYMNALLKKTQLSISLFHHAALSETAAATIGPLQTLKIIGNAPAIYRALKNKDYALYNEKFEVARDGIKHGMQAGAISDVQRDKVTEILEKLESDLTSVHKVVGLPIKGIRKFNEMWDAALWDYLHNNLKVYGYEAVSGRMIRSLKNPTPDQITGAKKEAAQFINDTFGGQNWERMMTNPKTLQMAQWFLLSPDWTLSTVKQALSPTGIGAVANKGLRAKAGINFWAKAGLYFGVGVNLLNYALTAQDDAEEKGIPPLKGKGKWMWDNDPGHKSHLFAGRYDDGSKRYIRWGKQFRELFELLWDSQSEELSPITATLRKLGSKTSPMVQNVSLIFTGKTPSGFANKELNKATGWEWVGALSKHIILTPLPFSWRSTLDETKEFKITDLAFPSSKGMSFFKTRKLFKKAIVKKRQDFVKKIFIAATENNLDAADILKQSIRDLKAEATGEVNADIRRKLKRGDLSIEAYEKDPVNYLDGLNLSPRQKMSFGKEFKRQAERLAKVANWEQGIKIAEGLMLEYEEEKKALDKVEDK